MSKKRKVVLNAYDKRLGTYESAAYQWVLRRMAAYLEAGDPDVAEARDYAIDLVERAVGIYGDAASQVACDLYDQIAEAFGAPLPAAEIDDADVSGFIEKEVRYQARRLLTGEGTIFAKGVANAARDQVARKANQAMRANARRDGLRYARVPMGGETCTFCAMLASRGFVYRSAELAGEGNHYHPHCRCKVVPGFDGMEVEGYDPGEWYARWKQFEEIDADDDLSEAEKQYGKLMVSEGAAIGDWKKERQRLTVDLGRIGSKGYAAVVRAAFRENRVSDTALSDARRILRRRSGTPYEDLYAYDLTDGKRLDSVTNATEPQQVVASGRMRARIKAAISEGHEVAMLHNHPASSLPSAADFESLSKSGASFGVIACHDGTLYRYSVVGEPMVGYTLDDESIHFIVCSRLSRGKDEASALEALVERLGVKVEHLR